MKINFDRRLFGGNFFHLMKYLKVDDIRYIFCYGGSSSGKTYGLVQSILIHTLIDNKNTLVFRKVMASIRKTIFNDFKTAINQLNLNDYFIIQDLKIKSREGAVIDFLGMDDSEKIKGISSYQRIIIDELTELELTDWLQVRKRLRGVKGQKCICTFNPVSNTHWIKTTIFDMLNWKELPTTYGKLGDTITEAQIDFSGRYVALRSTYLNNPYVVGGVDENGNNYGFVDKATIESFEEDKKLDENYYRIYCLGQWGVLKSGLEFYRMYSEKNNMQKLELDITKAVWLSIDENVVPYSSMLVCQNIDDEFRILDEFAIEPPHNDVSNIANEFLVRYPELKDSKIYLTGDATSKKRDIKLGEGRNLFTILKDELEKRGYNVELRLLPSNPQQIHSGLFINKLFAGLLEKKLIISMKCAKLSTDLLSVKTADDGGILKEIGKLPGKDGYRYEKFGHLSDAMRYFVHSTEDGKRLFNKMLHKDSRVDIMDLDTTSDFSM